MANTSFYPPSGVYSDQYKKDMRIIKTKTQLIMSIAALIMLFVLPKLPYVSGYILRLIIGAAIALIICLGLNILTGYCGQLNIGQSAFVMVGAFTSALLNSKFGLPFWATFIPAGLAAATVGVFFGIPSVRLKGLYLALTTLGAQIILTWIALFGFPITAAGFSVDPIKIGSIVFNTPEKFYYIAIPFAIVMTFFAKNMMRSKPGRAFIAVRDNDKAAEGMGIDIFRYKLLAFAICTFYAGVAGSLLVHYMMWAQLESFTLQDSIWYLVMIIVGGFGSIEGTIFGVIFITVLKEIIFVIGPIAEANLSFLPMGAGSGLLLIIIGGMAIVFISVEPRGLAHRWNLFKAYYRLWPFGY
ncbi:MAG TPA: branched-chain amino acid ABC transporter permease [Syntrophus sp. (in: bacteria)]|jgi:branched-chain amino acid transport system permease protein|nr:branched-chain amino acid ABC transporter permease [Syntrophus sp. (in: bacteria)]